MSPWRIIFDTIGWGIIVLSVAVSLLMLWIVVKDFALRLWDARGEPSREGEWTYTSTRAGRDPERGGETE